MKAWVAAGTGKHSLTMVELPEPVPEEDQILVRSRAVSLNYRDKAILDGAYPAPVTFPFVLGSDVAGEVESVGSRVTAFKPGDQVVSVFKPLWLDGVPSDEAISSNLGAPLPGVLAEHVLLSESGALPYPNYLTPAEASTLPIAAVTAWVALFENGKLQAGDTTLIQGSGGVSLFGLQFARAQGARVLITTRSSHKLDRLRQLGASDVIDMSRTPDWSAEARALTGGRGVTHVVEVVGGDSLQRSIDACAWGAHIAIVGFLGSLSSTIALGSTMFSAVTLQGVAVGSRAQMSRMLQFLEQHKVRPVIEKTYPFDALPDAMEHLDRGPFGKIVVDLA